MKQGGVVAELVDSGAAIHLMGIGGAGMAGLARLMQARGATVSGCDQQLSDATEELERQGMSVAQGHSPDHVTGIAALVHTAAVPAGHPELEEAGRQGLPVVKRSQALADLVNSGTLVGIAGTHGKTTTSALTALALESAGVDPTALVGGRIPAWGGNARIGGGDTYVVEADEYDRSFLTLWPKIAVVTSVEAEHLDTYATFAQMEEAFHQFVDRVPEDGRVIACADDAGARRILQRVGSRGVAYGTRDQCDAELRAESIGHGSAGSSFSVRWRGESLGDYQLSLRGEHNVRNALAVIGVMLALDLEPQSALPALAGFTGVERRFQVLGEVDGITVVDDYAHHPTEVTATLEAARQVYGDRRLVVAFQPHLYTRTQAFATEFGHALAAADLLYVTEIYPAREKPLPGVTAKLVVDAAREELEAESLRYADDLESLTEALKHELRQGDVLLTLGAGDITSVAHRIFFNLGRSNVDA
jgi:UDP-N-acetylmuramate--alanine ligase